MLKLNHKEKPASSNALKHGYVKLCTDKTRRRALHCTHSNKEWELEGVGALQIGAKQRGRESEAD